MKNGKTISLIAGAAILGVIYAIRPSVDKKITLCTTCPPGFELTSNTCKLRSIYQLYEFQSGESAGVGGLKTALLAVRDGFTPQQIDHIGYKIMIAHSTIKLGATNLTNKYYFTGSANPMIGGMYYISVCYNLF